MGEAEPAGDPGFLREDPGPGQSEQESGPGQMSAGLVGGRVGVLSPGPGAGGPPRPLCACSCGGCSPARVCIGAWGSLVVQSCQSAPLVTAVPNRHLLLLLAESHTVSGGVLHAVTQGRPAPSSL